MSTHCYIAKRNENGTYTGIYCHFDGYISGVGQTLLNHYNDANKINELIALGDLEVLGEQIGEQHDPDMQRDEDWCISYKRDFSELGHDAVVSPLFNDVIVNAGKCAGDKYIYWFSSDEWHVMHGSYSGTIAEVVEQMNHNESVTVPRYVHDEVVAALKSALSCIETPGDLTNDEIKNVIEDIVHALTELTGKPLEDI